MWRWREHRIVACWIQCRLCRCRWSLGRQMRRKLHSVIGGKEKAKLRCGEHRRKKRPMQQNANTYSDNDGVGEGGDIRVIRCGTALGESGCAKQEGESTKWRRSSAKKFEKQKKCEIESSQGKRANTRAEIANATNLRAIFTVFVWVLGRNRRWIENTAKKISSTEMLKNSCSCFIDESII